VSLVGRLHGAAVFGRRVRVLAEQVAALLPPAARVLDVGCGDGAISAAVMEHRPDVTVTGIDVLVRGSTHVPVSPFDGTTIPFDDGAFDAAMFVDVLHHTDDPRVLLAEAARVAPGAIVVKDHLADPLLARPTLRAMDWVGNAHFSVALPYNYWEERQWRAAFDELGLGVDAWITDLPLYPPPLSWVFGRRLHVLCRLARRDPTGR
jgi:SAM-dependent methyltransferase